LPAPIAFLLGIISLLYGRIYTIVSSDAPGIPAYSQILLRQRIHLRTIIVIADIDEGLRRRALRINP